MTTIGMSILIGAALGLRFKALILIPVIILAMVGTAAVGVARGDQMWSVALTMVIVATAIQISYLVGSLTRAAAAGLVPLRRNIDVAQTSQSLDNLERMEVVGSDNNHVGTVDHKESDCIILTADDPKAGGKPHLISVDWVDYVDHKVHLNKPSKKAVSEWQVAA